MSIQPINNASMSMQAMTAAPVRDAQAARNQADAPAGGSRAAEARGEIIQQNISPQDQNPRTPDIGEVQKALEEVEKAVAPMAQSLQFSLDKDSGRTVVKVMDTDTNEVIRQIPSEEVLAISKAVDKLKGLLLKQQA
ncbi:MULTISPECIES: flagellar protein FlaG [Thauera]|jgi:flagellar protein FlaG|uniref:Flagellar protein FlaG n=2 Tax=Thauera aminoaromatica TaxID=164330 RepID=C4KAR1_THASP|nr:MULTISPECIES: flagellar protein FlaG [Thauera]MDA0236132.1 flagellar protein FlaG [Pseudomonadota bacterium]HNC52932.1 flagellar protein FlaG [Accumulibacter sp.]ACR01487.1 flagellar protein FlaG protein [Thauera aminoaromatica]ENO85940.1 flagellar protein FlaG protein [Thauera aminoaromatica S2]MBP6130299.1 flagellar protein FlaG [Thauera sp.]